VLFERFVFEKISVFSVRSVFKKGSVDCVGGESQRITQNAKRNTYNVKRGSLFGAGILCHKNTFGIKFQVFFVVFKHFLDFASVFGNKIVLLRRNSWVGALVRLLPLFPSPGKSGVFRC
jgi:hypothetical protein